MKHPRKAGKHKTPEGKKISKLRHEGIPQDQSVAMALNMSREGRLTKEGGYIRKHSRRRSHK